MGGNQWVQTVDDGLYASAVVIFGELQNVMYVYVLCGEFTSNVASRGILLKHMRTLFQWLICISY